MQVSAYAVTTECTECFMSVVFWLMRTNILEEHIASIFSVYDSPAFEGRVCYYLRS